MTASGKQLESLFQAVFSQEYERLCRYAYTYLQDEHRAEDIVQETFIRIWEQKKEMIGTDGLKFYLVTAVRNNCISHLRKQKTEGVRYTEVTPEPDPEPFFTARHYNEEEKLQKQKIADALNKLPPKCKEVFLLVKMQGLSYKEAAQILDISVKTIENQMGKALKIFRELTMLTTNAFYLFGVVKNFFFGIGVWNPFERF